MAGGALDESTKHAACEFIAVILTLDFLHKREHNRQFCDQTLELVCAHMQLEEQVCACARTLYAL
jgi:hypothetical protein